MTNVYKIELFVVDHDIIGADEIKKLLENTRYPNRCISPHVTNIEGRDIGEWDDSNPLNYKTTQKQELARLFSPWQALDTAPHDGTRILFFYGLRGCVFTAYYQKKIGCKTENGTRYNCWHLLSADFNDYHICCDEEHLTDCYWQPLMELPI